MYHNWFLGFVAVASWTLTLFFAKNANMQVGFGTLALVAAVAYGTGFAL